LVIHHRIVEQQHILKKNMGKIQILNWNH